MCREWSGSRPQPCFLLPRWPHAAAQESSCPAARCTSTIALPRFSSALADAAPEPKERSEAPGWVSNEQHVLYSVAPRDDICIFLSETAFSSSLRIELCRAVQKHTFQMLNSQGLAKQRALCISPQSFKKVPLIAVPPVYSIYCTTWKFPGQKVRRHGAHGISPALRGTRLAEEWDRPFTCLYALQTPSPAASPHMQKKRKQHNKRPKNSSAGRQLVYSFTPERPRIQTNFKVKLVYLIKGKAL